MSNHCCEKDESFCAVIPLEDQLSYVPLTFSENLKRRALIDTGAFANALPQKLIDELKVSRNTLFETRIFYI